MLSSVPKNSRQHHIITFSVMLATIMQALDATIANVALPHIQGSLAATQDQMAWVLTSYIVASAITIPLAGWLANVVGRKRVFLISIAGFVLASIMCGMAETLPQMILFRLLQGMCGAALVPLSQSILLSINSRKNYGKAMAMWGIGVTMGPILGPVLGGWLTEDYNWRWVFYINVPIGILAFSGLYLFLSETKSEKTHFDFFGFCALSLGIGALQIFLDRGALKDWFSSPEIIIEALLAGWGFYLFCIHTWTFKSSVEKKPFLNPALFRDRHFFIATLLIFVIGIVLFATLALIPPMLQNQLNYSVITAGLVTAPRGAGTMLAMFVVGRLVEYIDNRLIIAAGLLIMAFSLWQMTQFSLYIDTSYIISSGMIQGFGLGIAYIALSSVAFTTLPTILHNEGTAFFNLMRNLGSSIGISIVEALLIRNTQIVHTALAEDIIPYNTTNNYAYIANHVSTTHAAGVASLNQVITNQATMIAYLDDYQFIMIITLAVIPLVFFLHKTTTTDSL